MDGGGVKDRVTNLCLFFAVLFTTALLVSNILAAKLIIVGSWSMAASIIVFPISYIINDVLTEVYGFRVAWKIIWFGFAMNILMVLAFIVAIALPSPDWFKGAEAFAATLGSTPRIVVAGLIAYLLGSSVNAFVISRLKVVSKDGRQFEMRAILSTLAGEFIDSIIFVPIAFLGSMPYKELLSMIVMQVLLKTLYECIILPITSTVVRKVKIYEGVDVFDKDVRYGFASNK